MSTLRARVDAFVNRPVARERGRAGSSGWRTAARRHAPLLAPLGALIILAIFFSLASENFATGDNMLNILAQVSVLAVMATGVTFVLLLGEIDLGFANIAVLTGLAASLLMAGEPVGLLFGQANIGEGSQLLCMAIALGIALTLGLVAGSLTARLGVPSFVATLGVLMLAQGWGFYWSQGENVFNVLPLATTLGSSFVGPVPAIALSAGVVLLIAHVVLSRTRFGRYVYMTGANRGAAKLSGVPTERVVLLVFVISGLLAGIAGLLNVGRLGSAQAGQGDELLLPAIAAVVLGGTSLFGGRGGIPFTVVGLLLYGVIDNGLDQLDVDIYLKPFIRGVLLIGAVILNIFMLRLANRASAAAVEDLDGPETPPPPAAGSQPVHTTQTA